MDDWSDGIKLLLLRHDVEGVEDSFALPAIDVWDVMLKLN